MFGKNGLVQSGIFSKGKIAPAFDFTNHASSFLSISGKYTKLHDCIQFGDRNKADRLHGKGIVIRMNILDSIRIGYYNDGLSAPGNYLYIFSNGNLQVGEQYLKDGKLCDRGTRYLTNGTSEEFDH